MAVIGLFDGWEDEGFIMVTQSGETLTLGRKENNGSPRITALHLSGSYSQ